MSKYVDIGRIIPTKLGWDCSYFYPSQTDCLRKVNLQHELFKMPSIV